MRGNFSLIFYPSLYFLSLPSFPIPIPLLTMDGNQIRYKGIGRQLTVNLRPLTSPWLGWLVGVKFYPTNQNHSSLIWFLITSVKLILSLNTSFGELFNYKEVLDSGRFGFEDKACNLVAICSGHYVSEHDIVLSCTRRNR
jgi:hypothetical protein